MKKLYYVTGTATKADRTRNIQVGDHDCHAIPAYSENEAIMLSPLDNSTVKTSFVLNDDWQGK